MTAYGYAITAIVCGLLPVPLFLAWRLWPRHTTERAPWPVTTPVTVGFRYCPAEMRTRAAVVHPDRSATCADCGCPIAAVEAPHA